MSSRSTGSPFLPPSPFLRPSAPSPAAPRSTRRRALAAALPAALLASSLSGCGTTADASDGRTVTVTVGYQSKTINTVTAGTLLRSLGAFERRCAPRASVTGRRTRCAGRTTRRARRSPRR